MSKLFGNGKHATGGQSVCRHDCGSCTNKQPLERAQKRGCCLAGALCSNLSLSLSTDSCVAGNGVPGLGLRVINHCRLGQSWPGETGAPLRAWPACQSSQFAGLAAHTDQEPPTTGFRQLKLALRGDQVAARRGASLMADSVVRDEHLSDGAARGRLLLRILTRLTILTIST